MTNPYDSAAASSNEQSNMNILVPPVRMPASDQHCIALVGCGAIGRIQLYSYRQAGWNVALICDKDEAAACNARDEHFPNADITTDFQEVLKRDDITVVDLALHLDIRPEFVRQALLAGKHVLSQKPFVEKLSEGVELAQVAESQGVTLAVNQNGRWAPHFRALRTVIEGGHIGEVASADFSAYWAHDELVANHVLGKDPNLVLYDFAIHWFDLIAGLFPEHDAKSVYAITGKREGQLVEVPTMASVIIDYGSLQVTVNMRASARQEDSGYFHVNGSRGKVEIAGHSLGGDSLQVVTESGSTVIEVERDWFPHALIGSMADFLCAIENGEQPTAHPRSSLAGLSLCFAAMESAATGKPVDPAGVSTRYGL
ncbi:Gfo/Idh/MocA family oxidoreductase [Pseudomaricurvus alkylphenolicus]|jgi:predicted dehydrogenase|uniref:Gfo/Idh/MocA family protein n=1 Tax=Pseudomaricurvus alkylphenolicus TaxID=1306991 RepID=UPI00141F65D3|nr:Gfo/Idh/MocA family oxidoreductase [Pseudomaricurvus alkylphenolicus]NIB38230.1 Gfo/Idh/MocA family oxidoreductase [Pseudomaricurvus alkylphenolicus]